MGNTATVPTLPVISPGNFEKLQPTPKSGSGAYSAVTASINSNSDANIRAASTSSISIALPQSLQSNSMVAGMASLTGVQGTINEMNFSVSKVLKCCVFGIISCGASSKQSGLKSGTL